jgi:hypothetical protein
MDSDSYTCGTCKHGNVGDCPVCECEAEHENLLRKITQHARLTFGIGEAFHTNLLHYDYISRPSGEYLVPEALKRDADRYGFSVLNISEDKWSRNPVITMVMKARVK